MSYHSIQVHDYENKYEYQYSAYEHEYEYEYDEYFKLQLEYKYEYRVLHLCFIRPIITICNVTEHAVWQDSETRVLNTALNTVTQHKHKSN